MTGWSSGKEKWSSGKGKWSSGKEKWATKWPKHLEKREVNADATEAYESRDSKEEDAT